MTGGNPLSYSPRLQLMPLASYLRHSMPPVFECSGSGPELVDVFRLVGWLGWLGLDLVLSVAWSFGVQLVFLFCIGQIIVDLCCRRVL